MSKPKVAFFDFTSCEGCQLNKLNFENDLLDMLKLVDIVEFREAMDDTADEYDIAFIEGSISSPTCVERIHDIRRRTKILVALGQCAVSGGINAMKNSHPYEWVQETVYGEDKYLFYSCVLLSPEGFVPKAIIPDNRHNYAMHLYAIELILS